jgi:chemotaxis protein methyltransferase CheR
MSDAVAWPLVVDFMRKRCGLVLRDDQQYLLSSRIGPVADRLGFPSVLAFVRDAVRSDAPARSVDLLVDAMTTHETSFFRDPGFWTYMSQTVLPRLRKAVEQRGSAVVWSAACSTGQEAYSLAMLLDEEAPGIAPACKIVGTDVSVPAVDQARSGMFGPLEVSRGLQARRLTRHFEDANGAFTVKAHLRQRVSWDVHNLLGARSGPTGCDLVLCRNVLIYFDKTDRELVVKRLFSSLRPDGLLGVGTTEIVSGTMVAPGWYTR